MYDCCSRRQELEIAGHVLGSSCTVVVVATPVAFVSREALRRRSPTDVGHDHARHREPHPSRLGTSRPAPMPVGEPVDVTVELDATAYVVRARTPACASTWPAATSRRAGRRRTPARSPSTPPPRASCCPCSRDRREAEPPVFAPGEPEPHRPDHVTWTIEDDVLARERRVRDRPWWRARTGRRHRHPRQLRRRDRRVDGRPRPRMGDAAPRASSWRFPRWRSAPRRAARCARKRAMAPRRSSSRSSRTTSSSPSGGGSGPCRAGWPERPLRASLTGGACTRAPAGASVRAVWLGGAQRRRATRSRCCTRAASGSGPRHRACSG